MILLNKYNRKIITNKIDIVKEDFLTDLNADLIVIGSSNVFDVDWESDDVIWNWDITGASNNINTLQKDGANEMTVELNGDSADVDINQLSGTCAASGGGCATPNAIITLDITSDNSTIQINQKDSANDS